MPSGTSRTETPARVTPIRALGRTALLSGASSLLPIFAVVTYLTHRSPSLPLVLVIEAIVALLFVTVYVRFRRVYTAVTPTHFLKRRMLLPQVAVERTLVDRVMVNRVYRGGSTESLTQMIGVDALGRRVLGMSALFWTDDNIHTIVEALDVQTVVNPTPMSRRDYYRAFPTARGWYLSRPVVVIATVVVAILVVLAVLTLERVVGTA